MTEPFIKTHYTSFIQAHGRENINSSAGILQVEYAMKYTSRYGTKEIKGYPLLFIDFMNDHNKTILFDLAHEGNDGYFPS